MHELKGKIVIEQLPDSQWKAYPVGRPSFVAYASTQEEAQIEITKKIALEYAEAELKKALRLH